MKKPHPAVSLIEHRLKEQKEAFAYYKREAGRETEYDLPHEAVLLYLGEEVKELDRALILLKKQLGCDPNKWIV